MMDADLEKSSKDQQSRKQMLAKIVSQGSDDNAALNLGHILREVESKAPRKEGVSFAVAENSAYDAPTVAATPSTSRFDAIAKLKRAASQREMRGRGPEASTSGTPLTPEGSHPDLTPASSGHVERGGLYVLERTKREEAASPFLTRPPGSSDSKTTSPISSGLMRPDQSRIGSPSPQRSRTPETSNLLERSRSQRGDARSPLPSLEQLRARILQERATAGLARSASTSAASQAARAYALEKLLGESPRQGAVSPVSDTAEDQEEINTQEERIMPVAGSSNPRLMLRRSRTIGGLSAAADAQRKAAFVQALDEGVPEDVKSIRRSSRRFAKAPLGSRLSIISRPSDTRIFEEDTVLPNGLASDKEEQFQALHVPEQMLGSELDHNQSERQIARTEMMRKLSGRGKNGQRSPLPVLTSNSRGDYLDVASSDLSPSSPIPPVTPPAAISLGPAAISPSSNLLMVPGMGYTAQSPSSRPSTGMTSIHELDRNRASEMARLMGEEAFEYERLLELGYTTDDAYERVASARSGSYVDLSANASPRSFQGDFSHSIMDQQQQQSPLHYQTRQASQGDDDSFQKAEDLAAESIPYNNHEAEWATTSASIPLGLHSRRRSSASGTNSAEGGEIELLDNDNGILLPSHRRAAWPESVKSVATFETSPSPKTSNSSTERDSSEGGRSITKFRPLNLNIPPTYSVERIEEVLTPGFLNNIGNPLDFSNSLDSPNALRASGAPHRQSSDEHSLLERRLTPSETSHDEDEDYLQHVDRMTRRLGEFTRRNDHNTIRADRDAAIQYSSTVQAIAAASQQAQRSETPPMVMVTGLPSQQQQQQQQHHTSHVERIAPSLTSTPRCSPPTLSRPLPGSKTHSTSNSIDSFQHFTNGKLSPFPGLVIDPSDTSAKTSTTTLVRKTSPLDVPPNVLPDKAVDSTVRREQSDAVEDQKTDTGPSSKRPTFFTTLRRKASNAASKAHDNIATAGPTSTSPTSRKFGSLLRRRPSEAKQARVRIDVDPSTTALTSHAANNTTLRQAPSHDGVYSPPEMLSIPARFESLASLDDDKIARSDWESPSPLPLPTDKAALHRFSRMLTSSKEANNVVGVLGLTKQDVEHPPRTFLFGTPVLQVVTSSTVKDRYLFIFSDVLIIAKPIAPLGDVFVSASTLPTLEWTFQVKDIVDIGQITQLTAPTDERRRPVRNVTLMDAFVQDFQRNPRLAIDSLINRSGLTKMPATIAQLLHQTPELDRQLLTNYLFNDESQWDVTKAFIELEKLSGVSIESALRSLLLEIRFPARRNCFDNLLIIFAKHWTKSNKALIKETFTEQIAIDLVFAIMTLNDALHGAKQSLPVMFHKSNPHMSKDEFLHYFRPKDKEMVLSDRTLSRIYVSISQEAIQQGLLNGEVGPRSIARILSPGIPTRLIYGVSSDPLQVSIPRCDADFTIRLYGEDLAFQPQVLTFGQRATQEFKVMSKSLGPKSIVFIKAGRNARYYQTSVKTDLGADYVLPRSSSVIIERAFKQHCFTIVFSGNKKYTLSVEGEAKKSRCVNTIKTEMENLINDPTRKGSAHTLALHVLREALMEPDELPSVPLSSSLQRSASAAVPSNVNRLEMGALNRTPSDSRAFGSTSLQSRSQVSPVNRKESVSKHYYQSQGKREKGLAPMSSMEEDEEVIHQNPVNESSIAPLKGEELIVTVKQNSLLSVVVARLRQNPR